VRSNHPFDGCCNVRELCKFGGTPAAASLAAVKVPVYAYVVAVSTYGPYDEQTNTYRWDRPDFTMWADKVATYLEGIYGKGAVHRLFDKEATRNHLLQILNQDLPSLDPGALVIFYFIGHGFPSPPVEPKRKGTWPVTTLLGLHGSNPTDTEGSNYDRSISTEELVSAFAAADQCNFMIFLDCCHAGSASIVARAPDRFNHDLYFRGFALVASSADTVSSHCRFTEALLKVWKDPSTDIERTAEQIRAEVNKTIFSGSSNPGAETPQVQVPNITVGDSAAKMGYLNQGNCFVVFYVDPQAKNDITVSIAGHAPILFEKEHSFYHLTLPRKPVRLTVNIGSKSEPLDLNLQSAYDRKTSSRNRGGRTKTVCHS
jgi:hypothetical protein